MLYHAYEMMRAMIVPYRAYAVWGKEMFRHPLNPMKDNVFLSSVAAMCDVFETTTRTYDKPEWNLDKPEIAPDCFAKVKIKNVLHKPFCDLLHFKRIHKNLTNRQDPKVLVIAPMSGHYATLLRGTVQDLLPQHDVYITDWQDARMVPLLQGRFGVDEFIEYLMNLFSILGKMFTL